MADYTDASLTPRELDHELLYFEFMGELGVKNASHYELLARELVKKREIQFEINHVYVRYALDRVGCSFQISKDGGETFKEKYWVRTGWRKSARISYLPLFFAQCETSVLFKNNLEPN